MSIETISAHFDVSVATVHTIIRDGLSETIGANEKQSAFIKFPDFLFGHLKVS